jgi:hypothetical protein
MSAMSRAWRIEYEGAFYHLLSRGNEQRDIFEDEFVKAGRVSGPEKDKRDLMIYLLWKTGGYNNDQIGRLFGVNYSAVSHAVRSLKSKLRDNHELLTTFNKINSQFKL